MARMQLLVDGNQVYDIELEGWDGLPQMPNQPAASTGPQQSLPPQMKAMLLVAMGKMLHTSLTEGALLQPITATVDIRTAGFTLTADMKDTKA